MYRKAIFLDRDGTVIYARPYIKNPEEAVLLPGAAEGLRLLQKAGYLLIMITNQSGIGRGSLTYTDFWRVQRKVQEDLRREGVEWDAVYFCPHKPEEGCPCRKPGIQMLLQAQKDFFLSLSSSFLIGDKWEDIQTALNAGVKPVLVLTGHGRETLENYPVSPEFLLAEDLLDAARKILSPGQEISR
ncbi:MAG: D-glycero-alpha-D-manno-heptose-1,7-bisphosphate 7-phosphatase [bacterium JZ-2024 1]